MLKQLTVEASRWKPGPLLGRLASMLCLGLRVSGVADLAAPFLSFFVILVQWSVNQQPIWQGRSRRPAPAAADGLQAWEACQCLVGSAHAFK